jgi:hypothetical protein
MRWRWIAMSFNVKLTYGECRSCGREDVAWYWDGMTYNLAPMFRKAGFYDQLQRRLLAVELLPLVETGLADMTERAGEYMGLNPPNGWGDYDGAVSFTVALLDACRSNPSATVRFSG